MLAGAVTSASRIPCLCASGLRTRRPSRGVVGGRYPAATSLWRSEVAARSRVAARLRCFVGSATVPRAVPRCPRERENPLRERASVVPPRGFEVDSPQAGVRLTRALSHAQSGIARATTIRSSPPRSGRSRGRLSPDCHLCQPGRRGGIRAPSDPSTQAPGGGGRGRFGEARARGGP